MPVRTRSFLILLAAAMLATGTLAVAQEVERVELVIELREFSFTVAGGEANAPIVLEVGRPYRLVFANVGMMEHEVLIGRTVVMDNGMPDGYENHLLDTVPVRVVGDEWEVGTSGFVEVELEPGESVTIHVTLTPDLIGTWEIGCFVPGHYQAGMSAPVVVQ